MKADSALVLLVLLWAISRSKTATAATPPAAPAPAPAPESKPPARLPPIESRTPGIAPRATRVPWSIDTMRLFDREMDGAGVEPQLVLKGIAAASDFDPGHYLAENVGLAMVKREQLRAVGYPGDRELYTLTAEEQIPWIARVLAYRIQSTGKTPEDVGDLAVLINPVKEPMETILRNEAKRRAVGAERSRFYKKNAALLMRVQEEE